MPTIEELPDDTPVSVGTAATEAADGEPSSSTAPRRGGISEELAEKLARQMHAGPEEAMNSWLPGKSGKTIGEAMKTFDSVPLFMKELPEANDGGDDAKGSDAALEALKSLAFDGTPDEVAENFKKHGNDYFKAKRYREARDFYTQAIESDPLGDALRLSLYLNRAACNLEMHNYRLALKDTSAALGVDPRSVKAFYRAAKALSAVDKVVEAIDCCDHGLQIDEGNVDMLKLKHQVIKDAEKKIQREKDSTERERRKVEGDKALKQAFLARGLWIETSPRPPDNPTPAHFDLSELPSSHPSSSSYPLSKTDPSWSPPDPIRTPLVFPVMFLYPQHNQSDFISDFHEDTPLGPHLDQMFPAQARGSLPWDPKGEYVSSNLTTYASTKRMRLLKCGRALSLREVLDQGASEEKGADGRVSKRDGVVLKDGILSLVVLPKGSEAEKEWVERFKKTREEMRAKGQL